MTSKIHTILSIETSCDETAAAVVIDGHKVSSSVVSSQIPIHQRFGGVVPEIAARAHVEQILTVIESALNEAFGKNPQQKLQDSVDAIAVTSSPGLVGSLLVGVNTARTLARVFDKPLIPVNHTLGHVYSNFIGHTPNFPFLTLVASGGHTDLILSKSHGSHQVIGRTRDDAAGEAFDKAAQILGLSYPGGPAIGKVAVNGSGSAYPLPRAMMHQDNLDFSFSGLKTALLILVEDLKASGKNIESLVPNLAASFQQAVIDSLIDRTIKAARITGVEQINLAGGVAANLALRDALEQKTKADHLQFHVPNLEYCTDNAAMIGAAAYYATLEKRDFNWYNVNVEREPKLCL